MKNLIAVTLSLFVFAGCTKEKDGTDNSPKDSTVTTKKNDNDEKSRLEKENQELKEKLKQQEKGRIEEDKELDDKDVTVPSNEISDDKVKKDVIGYIANNDRGLWKDRKYDRKVQTVDIYERTKTGDGHKIMCNVKVTGGLLHKPETFYKLTMNYMKFGNEWKLTVYSSEQYN